MTLQISPTTTSVRRVLFSQLREAIEYLGDRGVLTALFATLFFLNYAGNLIDVLTNTSLFGNDLPSLRRTITGAEVLGFVAIAVVLRNLGTDRVLRWWDFVAIIGVTIASFYPSPLSRAIAMTCLGLLFVVRSDKRISSLGQLCIGLVWIDFWGALILSLIEPWLLPIESRFAYLAVSLFGPFSLDGVIISNGSGFAIKVGEPCSAFHNTITTAFIWLSLIKIQKLDFHFKHFVVLGAGLTVVVLLNTARLGILAVSETQYVFWHMGPGVWIVKIVMLSTVLGLFYFGLRPSQRRYGVDTPSSLLARADEVIE
jgi:hypothetical protein